MFRTFFASLLAIASLSLFSHTALGNDYQAALKDLADGDIRSWAQSPAVVAAVKEQNKKSADLQQGDIDKLDKDWRAETKGGATPMIDSVLANDLSSYLKDVKDKSQGTYTEIFVMDMKGLNVGQSDVTSDYWQGDEAKWEKSYGAGPDGILIDEVEFDDSSQTYQSQVSVSIVDPETNVAIGAVTVGVNVEALE
ncbi:MAG: hypothetical protein NXI13_12775 [Proteobacteria bacterium]|nr:hypothetical protein [Pseudomonadota bacterium]